MKICVATYPGVRDAGALERGIDSGWGQDVMDGIGIDGNMLPPAVISVVGAAALAAGTTQTLSTALVCLEFTRQQLLLIPVLLAVV